MLNSNPRRSAFPILLPLLSALTLCAQTGDQAPAKPRPAWAFLVPDKQQPPPEKDAAPRHVQGSAKTYTFAEIEDRSNTPDWFPEEHSAPPAVILHGSGPVSKACGSCHLMSGHGHPKSADLAGMPAAYLLRQLTAFKNGDRSDPNPMLGIAKDISDEDARLASDWFGALKPGPWVRVVEADTVSKSYVRLQSPMLLPLPGGGMEPLGNRIIELPEDALRASNRDPHSGFVAYVPFGSIARGESLVSTGGGKTAVCKSCHGEAMLGSAAPRLAGQHPAYTFRQLFNFQNGTRGGPSKTMNKLVVRLTEDDMIAIAAYLGSLAPQQ